MEMRTVDKRYSGNQTYNRRQLSSRDLEIARQIALGAKNGDVAETLGITPQTVSNVRNLPEVREIIEIIQGKRDERAVDISRQMMEMAPEALKLLNQVINFRPLKTPKTGSDLTDGEQQAIEEQIEPPSIDTQVRATMGLLKLVTPKMSYHQHKVSHTTIEEIKRRALEAEPTEEVEYEEVS